MFGTLLDPLRRLLGLRPPGGAERQFGAIPYRRTAEGLEFLLITSRRTGRWIFPKGGRMAWLSPAECAAQEAYEEAGVEGRIATEPLGIYHSIKMRDTGPEVIEVEMYPLEVAIVLDDWPEKGQRRRRWVSLGEACLMLSEPELAALVQEFAADAPGGAPGRG